MGFMLVPSVAIESGGGNRVSSLLTAFFTNVFPVFITDTVVVSWGFDRYWLLKCGGGSLYFHGSVRNLLVGVLLVVEFMCGC